MDVLEKGALKYSAKQSLLILTGFPTMTVCCVQEDQETTQWIER